MKKDQENSPHLLALARAVGSFFESREPPEHAKALGSLCERLTLQNEKGTTHLLASEYRDLCADPSIFSPVGQADENLPLVLTASGSLYFRRYFEYEIEIAKSLAARASLELRSFSSGSLQFFDQVIRPHLDDSQTLAVGVGMQTNLLFLTGGPGTGKTRTLALLLACMLKESPDLSIALAAPTGKSAHRMRQSIAQTLEDVDLPSEVAEKLLHSARASTLHRLLGSVHGSVDFRRNAGNPLSCDVVVVDEVSMVDLPLMAKLCSALSQDTVLILAGDADQLSPVQGGAVFNSLVRELIPNTFYTHQKTNLASFSKLGRFKEINHPLGGCLVNLSHSHRRSRQEPSTDELGNLCDAIREGRGEDALSMVRASEDSLCLIESLDDPVIPQLLRQGFEFLNHSTGPQEAISALGKFRILCAHNQGRFGVDGWNERVQKILPPRVDNPLPVVVGVNDYSIGLFNGDDGVIMNNIAHFPDDQGLREISCSRLPGHQIGYCTTIHRSQGSEFEQVLIVLPPADARLLSRELLYVATSRAKSKIILIGDPQSLLAAVERREDSRSGVLELLTTVK